MHCFYRSYLSSGYIAALYAVLGFVTRSSREEIAWHAKLHVRSRLPRSQRTQTPLVEMRGLWGRNWVGRSWGRSREWKNSRPFQDYPELDQNLTLSRWIIENTWKCSKENFDIKLGRKRKELIHRYRPWGGTRDDVIDGSVVTQAALKKIIQSCTPYNQSGFIGQSDHNRIAGFQCYAIQNRSK